MESSFQLSSSTQPKDTPKIALIFPPLVENNFGYYYPSTAVLAGYLSAQGIGCLQVDLNEDFATYLLSNEYLGLMAMGRFGPDMSLPLTEMPAVAARMLLRSGNHLLDAQGKHLYRDDSSDLAYLLKVLVQPFRIDIPVAVLANASFYTDPRTAVYSSFFEQTRLASSLPKSVSIAGISVAMGPQMGPALILAKYLKTHLPGIAVVLGGSAVGLMAEADIETLLINSPWVDAMVRYDGEYPLEALVKQKDAGMWQPAEIPGVSALSGSSVQHKPAVAGPVLDTLPPAEYDPGILGRLAKPEIGIVQSRGCYWGKCTYCDYIELYRGSQPYRARSPHEFLKEMKYQAMRHQINLFSESPNPSRRPLRKG